MWWAARILPEMPNLKHITLRENTISSRIYGSETLHSMSQIETLESLTLSRTWIIESASIQTEFNLLLPKLKELKVTGSLLSPIPQIIESYPGVLEKLEMLTIGFIDDARVLQVTIHIDIKAGEWENAAANRKWALCDAFLFFRQFFEGCYASFPPVYRKCHNAIKT